jgi:hypothetical protein
MANADDHLRLIKATLKATFGHTGALTNSDNQLVPAAGTSTKPAYAFAAEPTLGFYRSGAGVVSLAGGRLKGGADTGSVQMFLKEPASLGKVTTDTGKDYLELNGATYNVSDYPALAAFLGVASGTFAVPNMYDTARFPRSRSAAVAVQTSQSNTVGPHTHPDVAPTTNPETQEHTHPFSGNTGTESNLHTHGITGPAATSVFGTLQGGGTSLLWNGTAANATGNNNQVHTHPFSGTTSGRSATHNHTVLVSTPANIGTTETRPEAMAFVFAVKT